MLYCADAVQHFAHVMPKSSTPSSDTLDFVTQESTTPSSVDSVTTESATTALADSVNTTDNSDEWVANAYQRRIADDKLASLEYIRIQAEMRNVSAQDIVNYFIPLLPTNANEET